MYLKKFPRIISNNLALRIVEKNWQKKNVKSKLGNGFLSNLVIFGAYSNSTENYKYFFRYFD